MVYDSLNHRGLRRTGDFNQGQGQRQIETSIPNSLDEDLNQPITQILGNPAADVCKALS